MARDEDYRDNMGVFDRGHLTPNGDFSAQQDRDLTMITTNIAPQQFNNGNWEALENALRKYASDNGHALYIITGTGINIEVDHFLLQIRRLSFGHHDCKE